MLKSKYLMQIILLLLFFHLCGLRNMIAHEGHDHFHDTKPVTIERSTYTHFKSILSIYHDVYDNLIKGQLNSVLVLAQILVDTSGKGLKTESGESGRHMMRHLHHGAQRLEQAEGLQETQEAFALISEAVLPFFKSWPNQLKSNKIKIYQCNEHENYWLQHQELSPVCPYASTRPSKCICNEEKVSK